MGLQVDIYKKFKDFSLDVKFENNNGILGILGGSGCGKSMTLECIAGIEKPDVGKIVLNGKVFFDSTKGIDLPPQERKVGYLFQNNALFPNMTVEQNIGVGIKSSKLEKQKKIDEILDLFQLGKLKKRFPKQLSGGQQQRVALARTLVYKSDILLLDEPFSALDSYLKEDLQIELLEVLKEYCGDVILVSHNKEEIFKFCQELIVLDQGTSIIKGSTKEIFKKPEHRKVARLTGCKNIMEAKKESEDIISVKNWGMSFESENIPDDIKFIGIRAHSFKIDDNNFNKNRFRVHFVKKVEDAFEVNIIFKTINTKGVLCKKEIWWKVSREEWKNVLHEQIPKYLYIDIKDVIFLKE